MSASLFASKLRNVKNEKLIETLKSLSAEEADDLFEKICSICDTAVECEADSDRFPRDWLFHRRWEKSKKKNDRKAVKGISKAAAKETVSFLTVGGRTTAVVSATWRKRGHVGEGRDVAKPQGKKRKKK